MASFVG